MIQGFSFISFILVCLLILTTIKNCCVTQNLKTPASDFSRHTLVLPSVYHSRTRREMPSTRDLEGLHHSEVVIKVAIDDEEYVLDLRLSEDLVPEGHVIRYQQAGNTLQQTLTKEELDICQYSGSVRNKPGSWAAVSTCHGVRGAIYDGQHMRYIQPAQGDEVNSVHYIYDHSNYNASFKCGLGDVRVDQLRLLNYMAEHESDNTTLGRNGRYKREIQLHGPFKSNYLSRYVELVMVADNGMYRNEEIPSVHEYMKDLINIVNALYAPLNIFISLIGVEVWTESNRISIDEDGDITLDNFLKYRKQKLLPLNDNAHLITTKEFNSGVVGKAKTGSMCRHEDSGGLSVLHSDVIGMMAHTVAHELGHNLGMGHDDYTICKCPKSRCIMGVTTYDVPPVHWSSCSLKSLTLGFDKGTEYCLRNKPKSLFGSPSCGNGFVEPGEECDCGLLPDKKRRTECHSCCNPQSCRLKPNTRCASGECCAIRTCRPKPAGSVCRPALKECDLPEYCTGNSEFCPRDVFKMDSTSCGKYKDEVYCVSGSCKSHSTQCRMIWGPSSSKAHDKCYANNMKGDDNGDCGYDLRTSQHKKCRREDVSCGRLQCERFQEPLYKDFPTFTKFEPIRGKIFQCHTIFGQFNQDNLDPGLVPDGAKCGHNKMCMNQRCVSVETIRHRRPCHPSDCNERGVCNSEGHCHCDRGFAPPDCRLPGVGGSLDSGPAARPRPSQQDNRQTTTPSTNDSKQTEPSTKGIELVQPITEPSTGVHRPFELFTEPSRDSRPAQPVTEPSRGGRPGKPVMEPNIDSRPVKPVTEPNIDNRPVKPATEPNIDNKPVKPVTEPRRDGRPANPVTESNIDNRSVKLETEPSRDGRLDQPVTEPSRDDRAANPVTEPNRDRRPDKPVTEPNIDNRSVKPVTEPSRDGRPAKPVTEPNIDNRPGKPDTEPIRSSSQKTTADSELDGITTTEQNSASYNEESPNSTVLWNNFMVAMYVIFLGVLPLVLIILILIYRKSLKEIFGHCDPVTSQLNCFKVPDSRNTKSDNRTSFFIFPRFGIITSSVRQCFTYENESNEEVIADNCA